MNVSVVTVFPELYKEFLETSLIRKARERGIVKFDVRAFSSFCKPKEHIDGPAVGHGAGMVIRPEVVERAVVDLEQLHGKAYRIFFTPQGQKLDQVLTERLSYLFLEQQHVMLIAGRYEGIDQRAHEQYADIEISIGDYVLMGGDLPAMVLLEAVSRYFPGVVSKGESVQKDSFTGTFVDFPTYTAPRVWHDKEIPEILVSGNHGAMDAWRQECAVKKSVVNHFQWVRSRCVDKQERVAVGNAIPSHYAALLHDQVIADGAGRVGTSSVTSIDIHDIARSSKTYGLRGYFIVTPLVDQQEIVKTILKFWHEGGVEYNRSRSEAVAQVALVDSLEQAIADIQKLEGKKPLVLATSAKKVPGVSTITYYDQATVWKHDRPVLLIFGTAKGLCTELIERCDYVLLPLEGFSDFNHLSVRSAAAIIFDRWLGCNLVKRD